MCSLNDKAGRSRQLPEIPFTRQSEKEKHRDKGWAVSSQASGAKGASSQGIVGASETIHPDWAILTQQHRTLHPKESCLLYINLKLN